MARSILLHRTVGAQASPWCPAVAAKGFRPFFLLASVVPIALPMAYLAGLVLAGALWSSAFIVFVAVYAPILCRARVDGRFG